MSIDSTSREHCSKTGGWLVVASLPTLIADEAGTVAEPTFLGLLNQPQEYVGPISCPCPHPILTDHLAVSGRPSRRHGRKTLGKPPT
jgi:hypothetical protein